MMIATPASSVTLPGRECALQAVLRGVLAEYRGYLEAADAYQAYLQQKVDTLEALADAIGGTPQDTDFDDEIMF